MMLIIMSLPYVCVLLLRWSKRPTWRHVREGEWGRGRGLHGQGSYRLRPRLRWGGLLPRSGSRREVRGWLGRGMPGEDRRGLPRGGATLPGSLGGRDPARSSDRKPQGRLRGQDGKTCGPLRKSHGEKRRLPRPSQCVDGEAGGGCSQTSRSYSYFSPLRAGSGRRHTETWG